MHKLTEKSQKFVWDSDCQEAFDKLKRDLTSSSILSYPKKEGQYVLDSDASNMGMGSVIRYRWNLSNTWTTYFIMSLMMGKKIVQ